MLLLALYNAHPFAGRGYHCLSLCCLLFSVNLIRVCVLVSAHQTINSDRAEAVIIRWKNCVDL